MTLGTLVNRTDTKKNRRGGGGEICDWLCSRNRQPIGVAIQTLNFFNFECLEN